MDSIIEISIGIPFYNAERFFALAVKSVLCQSFSAFELILTNDGSTDSSLEIAKSFNDPRIIILSDGANRGIAYRLNEQIAISKGKYFVRMDADDIMFPNRLKRQLEFMKKNDKYDIVSSYAIVIDNENQILGLRESAIPNSLIGYFRSSPFIHPTVMGKIEWFRKFNYINELQGVEDSDLWIRSCLQSNFFTIEEPLMFYRDPLKIKLSTYIFRVRQRQKLYKLNSGLLKSSKYIIYYFKCLDFLKLTIYSISKVFKFERFLLKKRNNILDEISYNNAVSVINSIVDHRF